MMFHKQLSSAQEAVERVGDTHRGRARPQVGTP